MLRSMRLKFAKALLGAVTVTPPKSEEIAWVIPIFNNLSVLEQSSLLQALISSSNSRFYSPLLVERLHLLWSFRDTNVHALRFRVLQDQSPPFISPTLVMHLMNSASSKDELKWVAQRDPLNFLGSLLDLQDPKAIVDLPTEALIPLFGLETLPTKLDHTGLLYREIVERLKPFSANAYQLLSKVIIAVNTNCIPNFITFTSDLCSQELIANFLKDNPLALAEYVIALQELFAQAKLHILLQLSVATTPSALNQLWREQRICKDAKGRETLLYVVTELYKYWLLVATDAELVGKSHLGFDHQDLIEYATALRDKVFELLWLYRPDQQVKISGVITSTLIVLRQLYTRDSRMHLFREGFWLMGSIPQASFVQTFENTNSHFSTGPDNFDVDEDDDEEIEEFRYEGEASMNPLTSGLEIHSEKLGRPGLTLRRNSSENLDRPRLILRRNPSVRVLEHAPFFVSFQARAALFYKFIVTDKDFQPASSHGLFHFDIDRENIVQDARQAFSSLGPRIKTDLQVRLISNGAAEAGVDGGGLRRELLMSLCDKIFFEQLGQPRKGSRPAYFIETANHTISPNPVFGESPELFLPEDRAFYMFAGQLIGKCLYENLLVDVEFAPFFLAKWNKASVKGSSTRSGFDDLSLLDEELYQNISKLHDIHGSDVEALGLDFTVVNSQRKVVELRPDGLSTAVTDSNKLEYMRELAHYKLNKSLGPQTQCFMFGLSQVIRLEWLSVFNPHELNKLISGETRDFDIEDLKRNSVVFDISTQSASINHLWQVLEEFSPSQRAKFLRFVTSVPKAPLLGFSHLEPRLGIRFIAKDDQRLPTAATCLNLLKLPEYSTKEILREKLLYSINSKAGFELS